MFSELIERIRRHVDEVGDCWEWTGALQPGAPTPVMRYKQRTSQVRRFIALAQGKPLDGKLATCKCRNELCVNPDHVIVVTRKRLQAMVAKERNYATHPARMKKISDAARARGKLTLELALEIREAEGPQREIALRYGITQATVHAIKSGKTWRDYTNPFAALFGAKK